MADKTLGEVLHEAREAGNDGRDRPMFLAPWAERDPRLKMLDEAMAEAVAAEVRERIAREIDGFAQLARDAAGGYPADPGPPTTGHARSEMQGRAGAYVKSALMARGDTGGGEEWGEP